MAETTVTELSESLRQAIAGLEASEGLEQVGIVTRVGDGVAWVHGLRHAGYSEVLEIETKTGIVEAFALNLMEDEIGAVLLGSDQGVAAGDRVKLKGEVLSVPVGEELLGRVVNPLGEPLDGGPAITTAQRGLVAEDEDPLQKAAEQLRKDGVDVLHTIGGDDTNTTAADLAAYLHENDYELTVVGLPKTIDNDVVPIRQSLGAWTAADEGAGFAFNVIGEHRSNPRMLIVHECMGRNCGYLTADTPPPYPHPVH